MTTSANTNASLKQRLSSLQGNMLNFALILTSDRNEAYELLQAANLKALDSLDTYLPETSFKGWAFTIMRSVFAQRFAARHEEIGAVKPVKMTIAVAAERPEGTFTVDELCRAIDESPEECREAFMMHITGYTTEEISHQLRMSRRSLNAVCRRVMNSLMR